MRYAVTAFCAWVLLGGAYVALGLAWNYCLERRTQHAPALRVYLGVWLREWFITLVMWASYAWGWRKPPRVTFDPEGGPPIALVHGYFMNWVSMYFLAAALKRNGLRNIYYLEPRPLGASLEDQSRHLAKALAEVSAVCGGRKVVAMGHSQGGLLLRAAAEREPALNLSLIVTLGAPVGGSAFAALAPLPNGREMRVGSTFLKALGSPKVPLLSIYSQTDNVVFPAAGNEAAGTVRVPAMGHFGLITRGEVVPFIVEAIKSSTSQA